MRNNWLLRKLASDVGTREPGAAHNIHSPYRVAARTVLCSQSDPYTMQYSPRQDVLSIILGVENEQLDGTGEGV